MSTSVRAHGNSFELAPMGGLKNTLLQENRGLPRYQCPPL